jgi:hypothetical protein
MRERTRPGNPSLRPRALAAGEVLALAARRGTVVSCIAGEVWVTQEGDPRDYVVPAGARFCSAGGGRLVVAALGHGARVAVGEVRPEPAGLWSRNAVRVDAEFAAVVHRIAREQRARWFAGLVLAAWRAAKRVWRRRAAPPPAAARSGCRG